MPPPPKPRPKTKPLLPAFKAKRRGRMPLMEARLDSYGANGGVTKYSNFKHNMTTAEQKRFMGENTKAKSKPKPSPKTARKK